MCSKLGGVGSEVYEALEAATQSCSEYGSMEALEAANSKCVVSLEVKEALEAVTQKLRIPWYGSSGGDGELGGSEF